ncbi:MAG: hypothetical protein NTW87_09130 [Planctomycetota bacterium]|nr:hypothetical protein [Planctomycetota bacterium]
MADEEKSLHGWVPPLTTKEELYAALEKAFHYRGDVTITLKDGSQVVGYVFDRNADVQEPFIRVYPQDKDVKLKISYADVAGLTFTGQDLAAGNSWAAWVAKNRQGLKDASPKAG